MTVLGIGMFMFVRFVLTALRVFGKIRLIGLFLIAK